ncbi:MAG: RnfABCDGE type electron transport complex subunit B [Candidatus Aminicenantaceae bacterium]
MDLLWPIITMGALGLLFSTGLVFAYKKLKVTIDPKIEQISGLLPQANCGACGFSGCQAFAEAVVNNKVNPSECPISGDEIAEQIADILGVKSEEKKVKKVARILCRGTKEAAKEKGQYLGIPSCASAHLIGGNKSCSFGCLGFGDCARACPFDAIEMKDDGLPHIIEEKCTACGICVEECPRNIIELFPLSQNIFVFCRSHDNGKISRKVCKNACIACNICVRACPEAIVLENNLAKITDVKKIDKDKIPAIQKCPTGAIGLLKKEDNKDNDER